LDQVAPDVAHAPWRKRALLDQHQQRLLAFAEQAHRHACLRKRHAAWLCLLLRLGCWSAWGKG
jgi:hypothetical protein